EGKKYKPVRTRHGMSPQAEDGDVAKAAENGSQAANITQPDNMHELFPSGQYQDIPGLCKVATLKEIEEQGWSLNPGRYVGVAEREEDDVDFKVRLEELYEELELLNLEARELEDKIRKNISQFL